jgi:hypothetical protein
MWVACFDLDTMTVELVPGESVRAPRSGGNARLCFRVEDIQAARAELAKKDVRAGPVEEKGNGLLVTFCDPEGNEARGGLVLLTHPAIAFWRLK